MTYIVKIPKFYGDQVFCFLGGKAFQFFEFYKNEARHDKRNFK